LADRVATRQPQTFLYQEYVAAGEPCAFLLLGDAQHADTAERIVKTPKERNQALGHQAYFGQGESKDMGSAWGDSGALIHVAGAENIGRLRALKAAFEDRDIVLGSSVSEAGFHSDASGLIFIRRSSIPEPVAQRVLEQDQSKQRLKAASQATGIEKELRQAGKNFFALSPRWADAQESEVVYWLNPMEQSQNDAGWYTVDELRQWAKDTGPVVNDRALKKAAEGIYQVLRSALRKSIEERGCSVPMVRCVWKDEEKKEVVVELCYFGQPAPNSPPRVPTGRFSIEELESTYLKPSLEASPAKAPRFR